MTGAFAQALRSQGFALVSNDYGHHTLVLLGTHADIRVATSNTAALIERHGPDGTYSVMLSHVPDDVAVRIVEVLRGVSR